MDFFLKIKYFILEMSIRNIDIDKLTLKNVKNSWLLSEPIKVRTPKMYIPFGLEKYYNNYLLKLQFRNIKTDPDIKEFYDFIVQIEQKLKDLLNEEFSSSITHSEKYDPIVVMKLPQQYNKFICDAFKDSAPFSIFDIEKGSYCICDIIIDSIWKFKGKYYYKIKIKTINF